MKSVVVISVVGFILLFGGRSVLSECGQRLGTGIVMCQFSEDKSIDPFEFELCTHAHISTTTFLCTVDVCWPNNSTDFEKTARWMRSHLPNTLGFRVEFNQPFINNLPTRLKRLNTIKRLITFMQERGFSFVIFEESTTANDFENFLDRNSIKFIEELSGIIHKRGWHIGLSLKVGTTELAAKYDLVKWSRFVDWFQLSAAKYLPDQKYIQSFLPVSSAIDPVGTTEYWIKHVLQWLQPNCVLLFVFLIGMKLTAQEIAVEPGPGSLATKDPKNFIYLADVCEHIGINNCRTYWDDDSSTPWAACDNEYYTYVDSRSMRLRTDLARRYKLAGMIAPFDINYSGSKYCGDGDQFVYLRAIQGIRNVTN